MAKAQKNASTEYLVATFSYIGALFYRLFSILIPFMRRRAYAKEYKSARRLQAAMYDVSRMPLSPVGITEADIERRKLQEDIEECRSEALYYRDERRSKE